jgi:periplasmic copper chaperone A
MFSFMRFRHLLLAVCLAGATAITAPVARAADASLMVHDAWVQFVPGAKAGAAYFMLMNHGGKPWQLTGAECDSFEKAELHVSRITNGVATMSPVAQVDLQPMKSVKFEPGGLHVMLIGPKGELNDGATVEMRLVFSDGTKLPVKATLKKAGGSGGHSDHKH